MNTEPNSESTLDWRTLDLAGKIAIEASAGTGKTYTLVLLVLRLLLERELPPSGILLATFTDAATSELRARVTERVRQAYFAALRPKDPKRITLEHNAMSSHDPLAHYLSARWQGESARIKNTVRSRDEKLLERAMLQMDDMPIRTLHGICRQLLSSFDLVPSDIDADIEDGDALTEAALDDALRRRFTDVKALPDALLDALDKSFLEALSKSVKRVLKYGRITLRAAARVDAQRYQNARSALFRPSFRSGLREALADPTDPWKLCIAAKRGIENLLHTLSLGHQRQLPKASLKLFVTPESAQFKNAKRSILENPTLAQLCHFAQMHQFAVRGEFAALLNSLVDEVRVSRSVTLAARGGVSFDSMIEQLAERLAPSSASSYASKSEESAVHPFDDRTAVQLANAIHLRYPVALIDEFQDTDAQQWAILQAIYGTRGGLILVGDPKQSIYRFRGSDVHTFVRATKACERFFLQHNYRASAPLVAALNGFYGAVARPFHSANIDFRAALVGRQENAASIAAAFDAPQKDRPRHDKPWDSKKPLCLIEVSDAAGRYSSEDACLRTACIDIKNLLQAHADQGQAAPSVALLLSSNDQVRTTHNYLRQLGVHATASASLGVYRSQAAQVLQSLLCALSAPTDLTRARAARLALQLDSLDRVPGLDERALFRWVEHYLAQMLARGIGYLCLSLAAEPVCAAQSASDAQFSSSDQFIRDTHHLAELLTLKEQALLEAQPTLRQSSRDYAQALWQTLNAYIEQSDNNADSSEHRRIEAGARVQVLTVHKAKGLEFDVVYLPTLCFAKKLDAHIAIIPGAHGLECDAGSNDFENAILLEAAEALAEQLRLQYVALTRAKEAVNVYFSADSFKDQSALGGHLAQIPAYKAAQQSLELAAESACKDQINAVPVPVEVALKPWRAGLELLVKQEKISYAAREVTEFTALTASQTTVVKTAAALCDSIALRDSVPLYPDTLPTLRPSQRRISFSSMTQIEAKADAAGESELRQPNFERVAESVGVTEASAATNVALIEPTALNPQHDIIALEKFRGPNFGLALHTLFEDALLTPSVLDSNQVAARLSEFGFTTEAESTQAILALVQRNRHQALIPPGNLTPAVNLACLNANNCVAELGFQLPVRGLDYRALAELGPRFGLPLLFLPEQALERVNGMLIGFIDLVFQSGGKFYLLDYKSNWLGPSLEDYSGAALEAAMAQHYYHLQHLLYALALHRYLRLSLPDYDFDRHFGGAHYLFVRAFGLEETPGLSGTGHYQYRAPQALIEALDEMFSGPE